MKNTIIIVLLLFCAELSISSIYAKELTNLEFHSLADTTKSKTKTKEDIIKKGISFGPLPVIAFDQDKGFQYGALLNIYNFGDGSWYPNTKSQWYFEASAYTKGSYKFDIRYDNKTLIKKTRMSIAGNFSNDKALDFYGFNGYQTYYDKDLPTAFYRHGRTVYSFKTDFTGKIISGFSWIAGYHLNYFKTERFNKNDFAGKSLYDIYVENDIIDKKDAEGGYSSAVRFGFVFDTRNIEANPTKGIWAETHAIAAPELLGTSKSYFKLNFVFRQYVPLVSEKLTFAYRLNYQGFIGDAPFYVMPFHTVVGPFNDYDGFGGYRTVRGLIRNRVQSLQVGFFNTELRWKFVDFKLFNQNIALNLSGFFDGVRSFKQVDLTPLENYNYNDYKIMSDSPEDFHLSTGAGFRFIMNQNFIVAFEYGKALNAQDNSKGSFYINTGFLF